ncbi:MAG: response regulator transcription factor [Tannerellaceae bacterium]|nr:response regulator transcription factor [Tannerellaceae bacterium]
MARILLVEDEPNISSFIERGLGEFGYEVQVASDGQSAWLLLQKDSFDLLVLDIIMPGMSGLELCRKYREVFGYAVPVVMLTALGTTEDIVGGLDAGADDYLVKPFSFRELKARVSALLRRRSSDPSEPSVPKVLQYMDLSLEPATRRAVRNGKAVDLTTREYKLLEYLIIHQGAPVSREDLIKAVWEREPDRNMNVVDVYVNYLRGKIDKGFRKKMIRTVTGIGYMLGI